MPLAVPFDSVKHYEDYIARLHQIPRAFEQTEETLRAGMKDKLMPVRFLLEKIPAQCDGDHRVGPVSVADEEISRRLFPPRTAAPDQGDQRRRQQRGHSGLQGIRRIHRRRVRAGGSNYAERRFIAGRQGALPQRHPQPHHHQQPDARSDSRDRPARDRAHRRPRCCSSRARRASRMSPRSASH